MLFEVFDDVLIAKEANDFLCEFTERKVRRIVTDPILAEKFIPDHPYGAKRPPDTDGYLEMSTGTMFASLTSRDPIAQYMETGIETSTESFDFDIVIRATGFDAVTGAFTRIDIRGLDGESLTYRWNAEGPKTFLGLGVHRFPNMLVVAGPQSPFSNLPGAQAAANRIADALAHVECNTSRHSIRHRARRSRLLVVTLVLPSVLCVIQERTRITKGDRRGLAFRRRYSTLGPRIRRSGR